MGTLKIPFYVEPRLTISNEMESAFQKLRHYSLATVNLHDSSMRLLPRDSQITRGLIGGTAGLSFPNLYRKRDNPSLNFESLNIVASNFDNATMQATSLFLVWRALAPFIRTITTNCQSGTFWGKQLH